MSKQSQRGNAIVFILIAIALFGALAFTFMRGAKTGQGNLTLGQSKMLATELVSYGRSLQAAVNKLISVGCSENQLSFSGSGLANYTNPSAPAANKCDVFLSPRTNIAYQAPSTSILVSTFSAQPFYGQHLFTGFTCFNQPPATGCETDLVQKRTWEITMFTPYIDLNTCEAINKVVGITGIPVDTGNTWSPTGNSNFIGAFNGGADFGTGLTIPANTVIGCFQASAASTWPAANSYYFFSVLLFRN